MLTLANIWPSFYLMIYSTNLEVIYYTTYEIHLIRRTSTFIYNNKSCQSKTLEVLHIFLFIKGFLETGSHSFK